MSSQSTLHSSGSNENALHSSGSNVEGNGSMSFQVEGTIYGKFDSGYLVTVQVGSEVLNGVLFHPEEQIPPCNAIVPDNPPPDHHYSGGMTRRNRRRRRTRDPNLPKPKWSGYTIYYVEKQFMLNSRYPRKRRDFTKMIAKSWNNLPFEEKKVYKNYAVKDGERHKKEWKEYNERKKTTSSCN